VLSLLFCISFQFLRIALLYVSDTDLVMNYEKVLKCVLVSGYVDTGSPTVGSGRSWKSMEMEIQSLLEKLLDINDSMSRCAASAAPTTSVTQKLARHRDILHEYTQVFLHHI